MNQAPPPVINCARVLAYAVVDDIPYHPWGLLLVEGIPLEHVPRLAICTSLGKDMGILLFHCDDDWNVLGTSGGETIDDVKEQAEKNYPGAMSRWINLDTTIANALAYYDKMTGGAKCSFCGKRAFDCDGWVERGSAIICCGCIEEFYNEFNSELKA